jgi:hypothetical protein
MTETEMIVDFMRAKAAYMDDSLKQKDKAKIIDELADDIEFGTHLPENRDPRYPKKVEEFDPPAAKGSKLWPVKIVQS